MQEDEGRGELTGLARPRIASGATASAPLSDPRESSGRASDADREAPARHGSTVATAPAVAPPGSCPFLHLDGEAAACHALAPSITLSARQVEILCVTSAHGDCPRHLRGGTGERPIPPRPRVAPPEPRPEPPSPVASPEPIAVRHEPAPPPVLASPVAEPAVSPSQAGNVAVSAAADEPASGVRGAFRVQEGSSSPAIAAPVTPPQGSAAPVPTPALVPPGRVPYASAARAAEAAVADSARTEPATPSIVRSRRIAALRSQAHDRSVALRPATAAAILTLMAAIVIAVGFAAVRGGLSLPTQAPSPSGLAGGASGAQASGSAGVSQATGSPASSPTAGPSQSPSPSLPSPGSSISPSTGAGSPSIAPDRLALLTACPGKSDCYIYRIAKGDNLRTVAKFFGVPYQTLLQLNPQIANPSLIHIGDEITLPTPG